jgi:hypothetical protein
MFTTQHYRAVASILHEAKKPADSDSELYLYWYEELYTPFVEMFKADNEHFDMLTFSWAVATGKHSDIRTMRGDKLRGESRENAEQVREP